jgi:hypothetical protein
MVADPVRLLEAALDDVELRGAVLVLAHDELRGPRGGGSLGGRCSRPGPRTAAARNRPPGKQPSEHFRGRS